MKTCACPPDGLQHGFVDADGVALHTVDNQADGPLVIFLHGFPQFWWVWRHQLAFTGWHAVAYDQRGYNFSDRPDDVSIARLCADVEAVVRSRGATRAVIVGHDWGGLVAWELAMRRPELVSRLVVVNMPHPAIIRARVWRPEHWLRLWYVWFFQLPLLPEWAMRAGNHALVRKELALVTTPAELERYVEAAAQPGAMHAAIGYYRAAFREYVSRGHAVKPIAVPTLIVWGERDRHIARSLATPPAELVPDLQFRWLPEATHWVQDDSPAALQDALRGFLLDNA